MQPELTVTPGPADPLSAQPDRTAPEILPEASAPVEEASDRFVLRIALKLLAAAALILMLILFTSTEVDFVYTGF